MVIKSETKTFKIGGSKAIRIPSSIRIDSTYPFNNNQTLIIEIKGKEIVIRKKNKTDNK